LQIGGWRVGGLEVVGLEDCRFAGLRVCGFAGLRVCRSEGWIVRGLEGWRLESCNLFAPFFISSSIYLLCALLCFCVLILPLRERGCYINQINLNTLLFFQNFG